MKLLLLLVLISATTSLLLGKPLIKALKSLKVTQTVRDDGPKSHKEKKSNIPTIGGLIFLIPVFLLTFLLILIKKDFQTSDLYIVMFTTFAMAALGFVDDYLKIFKKHNKGVSGWTKLIVQLLISALLAYKYDPGIGLIYFIWVFFIISGASNSFNLTDGLDGLLASISVLSFLGFTILLYTYSKSELVIFSVIFLSAIIGFLYFNRHPAKVFMGDTGSLAIGGAIGGIAVVFRSELYLICFATVPIIEALSVILQVVSYQLSKRFLGKDIRIFKMAPLHHHFEFVGWNEGKIVKRFFLFQLICILVGISIVFLT